MIYTCQLQASFGSGAGPIWADFQATGINHVKSVLQSMQCRDPMEDMLVQQALWTHARVAKLTILAKDQTQLYEIRILHEACNKASNTYRRLMLALAEKRRPKRSDAFVAIKQANLAQQQVVQNSDVSSTQNQKYLQTNLDAIIMIPNNGKRKYKLTPAGLASLRRTVQKTKPWLQSTGPITKDGKARSCMNAWKHGERAQDTQVAYRRSAQLIRFTTTQAFLHMEYIAIPKIYSESTIAFVEC